MTWTRAAVEEEIARRFAKRRAGSSVYMDGSHNPTPNDLREATEVVDLVLQWASLLWGDAD